MKKKVNRRDFLRLSATVGAGAFFMPGVASLPQTSQTNQDDEKIPVRTLGRTGIQIPILSMGVMRADNPNVVRAAYNSGIYHFDTAHGYQNGRNEEMLGNFFEGKPRDSFFIATKIKFDYPLKENFEQDLNEKLDISLKRLKMNYIDVFYAHAYNDTEVISDSKVIEALINIKNTGKARFIGFSTHAHKPEQLLAAIDAKIYDVILLSYNFKLKNLKETQEAIEKAAKAGIGIVAMKTMTGAVEDAEGTKRINAQACLKWAWENEYITTVIPGFSNYDELDDCLAAAASPALTTDEKNYLAALRKKEMLFCQQCETCIGQCPQHLPIPDMMRAYMYAYGYKQAHLSKETLLALNVNNASCSDCDQCSVTCPSGFDVAKKIAAIIPLTQIPTEFLT